MHQRFDQQALRAMLPQRCTLLSGVPGALLYMFRPLLLGPQFWIKGSVALIRTPTKN